MLYWAEGSKSRNVAALTNPDPDLLTLYVRLLRECYAVNDDNIALAVNCPVAHGLSVREIEEWWLRRLASPRSCLRSATVNLIGAAAASSPGLENGTSSASQRRRGHALPYGTASVCAYSVFVVGSIYGAIQAYAGIDRPEWLD